MKPSHRKDVIIARIIFAFICLALIGIIAAIVIAISSHHKSTEPETQTTQTESESDIDYADESLNDGVTDIDIEVDTEIPTEVTVRTTSGVRLRMEPSIEASIITVVPEGTELLLVAEKEGWAEVIYDGQTGYVSTEFIVEVPANPVDGTDSEQSEDTAAQVTDAEGDSGLGEQAEGTTDGM